VGAQPTERVALFFGRAGLIAVQPIAERPTKGAPKKKAQERMKAEAEAAQG
jgi:small subunit ribosomal protein S16